MRRRAEEKRKRKKKTGGLRLCVQHTCTMPDAPPPADEPPATLPDLPPRIPPPLQRPSRLSRSLCVRTGYAAANAFVLAVLYSRPTSVLFVRGGATDAGVEALLWMSVVRCGVSARAR